MKKSQIRKLEKKRKAERERRKQQPAPLAYHGRKYQTDRLLPLLLQTETAIYEAFVVSNRSLTDHDVRETLERLIVGLRNGRIDPESQEPSTEEGTVTDFLVVNLLNRWRLDFEKESNPGRDNLIGILRTVLGSVENRSNVSPTSREYLKFIEKVLREIGIRVRQVSREEAGVSPDAMPGKPFRLRDSADAEES